MKLRHSDCKEGLQERDYENGIAELAETGHRAATNRQRRKFCSWCTLFAPAYGPSVQGVHADPLDLEGFIDDPSLHHYCLSLVRVDYNHGRTEIGLFIEGGKEESKRERVAVTGLNVFLNAGPTVFAFDVATGTRQLLISIW